MEKYVIETLPRELTLEIDLLGNQIGRRWDRAKFAKAEALLKKQYATIRKAEETKVPDGKRYHKGSYLHSWGLSILEQKNFTILQDGYRKMFLAYVEDLLDYENIENVHSAAAYNALYGNPFVRQDVLELLHSRVDERKRKCKIPKNPEDVLPKDTSIVYEDFVNCLLAISGGTATKGERTISKNVFIVHGWDDKSKLELARMLETLKLKPIILSEMPNKGKTIMEKLELNSNEVGYVFVILTPDDMAGPSTDVGKTPSPRARQNVILELGYFIGKLGRNRVCCLYKDPVELPSDIHGIVYKKFDKSVEECFKSILAELRAAGYNVKA